MPPAEARRAAVLKFGGVEGARESARDEFRFAAIHEFARDLKVALRGWKRSPGAAMVALLTLAIGIGANTAIFSILHALILNPLPFPEIDRVVAIWDASEQSPHNEVAYANFADWQKQQTSFSSLGLYRWWTANITGDHTPERVQGFQFAGDMFEVLGLKPHLGRSFSAKESEPAADRVALIGHGLWVRRYGADPSIVGRTVVINDVPRLVIGVLPKEMNFPPGAEVVTPLRVTPEIASNRKAHAAYVLARLKPAVSLAQANADIASIMTGLERLYPDTNKGLSARAYPLAEDVSNPYRGGIWLLMASVAFVLLIACANLANLLLAREPGRARELAVRASIGATRGRLIRQLVAESLALSLAGGALGAGLAALGVRILRSAAPNDVLSTVPGLANLAVDMPVLLFTTALSVFTGLAFGLLPAWRASTVDTTTALRESRRAFGSIAGTRLRGWLVGAEVALALILLSGAGATMSAFVRLASLDLGFSSERVLTMGISLPYARYQNDAALAGFYTTLLERARAVPGVVRVGLASHLPLDPGNSSSGLVFEGREASAQEPEADHRVVSAGTFETLGVTLTKGRGFLDTDGAESPRVIIVNEAFGRRFFPETDPLGRRVRFSGPPAENPWREIVGVVRDFRHEIARDPRPETYIPYTQGVEGTLFLVARAQADARGLANPLRDAVKSIDPNQPVWAVRTLDEIRTRSMAGFRALVGFIGAFSTVAMFLSAVGIFGVVSFLVSSRTQEIGLRMALGAREGDVVRLVMAQSSASLAAGLSVGAAGAVLTTRLLASAFTEMRAADPWSVMPSAALLASVAAFAVWLPARRAASVAPTDALRAD